MMLSRRVLLGLTLVVLILGIYFLPSQVAYAASMTFSTDTTITADATIAAGETWTINPGVTVEIASGVNVTVEAGGSIVNNGTFLTRSAAPPGAFTNRGTITNYGTHIHNTGTFANEGIIENYGTSTIFGIFRNAGISENGIFNNNSGGELITYGTFFAYQNSAITNNGTIITYYDPPFNNGFVSNGIITNFGMISTIGSFLNTSSGQLTNSSGGQIINNSDAFENGGTFVNDSGGVITNNIGGTIDNAGGTITNDGIIANSGTIENTHDYWGTIGGTFDNYGTIDNYGDLENSAGTLTNIGTINNSIGSWFYISGGTFDNQGTFDEPLYLGPTITDDVEIINGGSVSADRNPTINGGARLTLTGATSLTIEFGEILTNFGTIINHVTIVNQGELINNGTFDNRPTGTLTNNGTITNSATGEFASIYNYGTFTNDGSINNNDGQFTNRATFTNAATGQITTAARINIDASFTNDGVINIITTGVIINGSDSTISNNGTITVDSTLTSPSFINNSGSTVSNSSVGTITLNTGEITNEGQFTNDGALVSNDFFFNTSSGIVTNTGSFDINGMIINSGGQITNSSGGQIVVQAEGQVENRGVFNNSSGGQIIFESGATMLNSTAAVLSNDGRIHNNAGATITNTTSSSVIDNSGTIDNLGDIINDNGGTLTNSGLIISCDGVLEGTVSGIPALDQCARVNTTDDEDDTSCNADHCSLREAINAVNTDPNRDLIIFDIPESGPHTIQLELPLPVITQSLTIDGYTQSGASPATSSTLATLMIELDGSDAGADANGLVITAGNSTVRGLVINRFSATGILLHGNGGNVIVGNYLGTDVSGTVAFTNGEHGIHIVGVTDNIIGGADPGDRNIISGNADGGVRLSGATASNNTLLGNFVGIGADGTALPNGKNGVVLNGAPNNTVGGDAASGNVISGNGVHGLVISGLAATGNLISDNLIGTDPTGTVAVGNAIRGVSISGSADNTIRENVISGNTSAGVVLRGGASGNQVLGNYIGTDVTGSSSLGNSGNGVSIEGPGNRIGGTNPDDGNVISGNNRSGIQIIGSAASANVIQGNLIGTDVSGTVSLGNRVHGIQISDGAHNNAVGGTVPGARNIISGNGDSGIAIFDIGTRANQVRGNFIGTDVNGTSALPNVDGIWLGAGAVNNGIGGLVPRARNIISGNTVFGVSVNGSGAMGNEVQGNYIGADVSGAQLANGAGGVVFTQDASDNTIGGTDLGAGNLIAFNAGPGVKFHPDAGTGNAIVANAIHSNAGLGIDLEDDGVTLNDHSDADTGPNELQNFPTISALVSTSFGSSTSTLVISGSLLSTPSTSFTIELFATPSCDPSGHGEGDIPLGSTTVVTDGAGQGTFSVSFSTSMRAGFFVTGTATDPDGNTSEFSACAQTSFQQLSGDLDITWDQVIPAGGGDPVVRISGDALGGVETASLDVCGETSITMSAGDEILLQCGSADIEVILGPIEIQLGEDTEAIVPPGGVVLVDEIAEGELKLENDSPVGSEPVVIVVGGQVVAEVEAGGAILEATLVISRAEVVIQEVEGEDQFEIEGSVGSANGLDLLTEEVAVTFGTYILVIPAGAFEADGEEAFKYESEENDIVIRIQVAGVFKIEVRGIDLSGVNLATPVPFALEIGDELGTVTVPFDEDGEFEE
jgi:CSLREA domain-containing protein